MIYNKETLYAIFLPAIRILSISYTYTYNENRRVTSAHSTCDSFLSSTFLLSSFPNFLSFNL